MNWHNQTYYVYYRYSELSHSVDHDEYFLNDVKKAPLEVNYLRLSGEPFYLSPTLLEAAVKLIKPTVTHLWLNKCGLHKATNNLDKIFESIPSTVEDINLDFNHLSSMSSEELETAFSTIRAKRISLEYNGIDYDEEKLSAIMLALPENVEFVTFQGGHPINRSEWVDENRKGFSRTMA